MLLQRDGREYRASALLLASLLALSWMIDAVVVGEWCQCTGYSNKGRSVVVSLALDGVLALFRSREDTSVSVLA